MYQRNIKKEKSNTDCAFCAFQNSTEQVVSTHDNFWIVKNKYPYDLWDQCGVLDHLMVVPKRHTDTLAHLNTEEQLEYIMLVASYETQGYSVYSRAPGNAIKSVFHLHTHLIKLDNKPKKLVVFSKRPSLLITK